MAELGIELIYANSPQAKGRVERVNQILQDRLVKELRLTGIEDYRIANAFLKTYLPIYNQKFAVQPILSSDCHEPIRTENDLALISTQRFTPFLSKDLIFQFKCTVYQILTDRPASALRGRKVEI